MIWILVMPVIMAFAIVLIPYGPAQCMMIVRIMMTMMTSYTSTDVDTEEWMND